MKKCPFCAEEIQDDAIKCRYCSEWLNEEVPLVKATIVDSSEKHFTSEDIGKTDDKILCPDENCLGAINADGICPECHRIPEQITKSEKCEKCGYERLQGDAECPKCGIVYHKYEEYHVKKEGDKSKPLSKEREGKIQCPQCEKWDVYKTMTNDFGYDDYCPNCKQALKSMGGVEEEKSTPKKPSSAGQVMYILVWIALVGTLSAYIIPQAVHQKPNPMAGFSLLVWIGVVSAMTAVRKGKSGWLWFFIGFIGIGISTIFLTSFFKAFVGTHNKTINAKFSEVGEKITLKETKDAETYINRGLAYVSNGQYDKAIANYTKAMEINPRDAKVYNSRGAAYYRKGQYDQSIADYNKAIEINPRGADAYILRGLAYGKGKGQYDQAISDYTKAIEINPRDAGAYIIRGGAYADKGQYDQAISDFTKSMEINPRDAKVYKNRGVTYCLKGQFDKSIADFNKAIEINPKYADAYTFRAIAYEKGGQFDQAIADFTKAIEINPLDADACIIRGDAYADKGQYDQAIADYNKAMEINPRDAKVYKNRAIAYESLGNYNSACDDWQRACKLGNCDGLNWAKQKGICQ